MYSLTLSNPPVAVHYETAIYLKLPLVVQASDRYVHVKLCKSLRCLSSCAIVQLVLISASEYPFPSGIT